MKLEFKDLVAMAKIGLHADPRRASWPVKHQVRASSLPEPERPKPVAGLLAQPTYIQPTYMVKRLAVASEAEGKLAPRARERVPARERKIAHQGWLVHWIMWRPTHGDSLLVERVGTLELSK